MGLSAIGIRDDLLGCLGLEDTSQAPMAIRRRITQDINAALQIIYTNGPAYLKEKSFTSILNAPREINGKTFSLFSTEMSGGDEILDNMRGCTVRIDGEVDNEIVNASTLQNPFCGTTTTSGRGTVYSDCVIFPENVAAISGPVWLDSQYQLQALSGRMELLNQVTIRRTELGQPRFYWVETYGGELRLRVYPMPDRTYVLRYDAQLKAPQLDFAALWPEVEADSSAELIINQVLTGFDSNLTGTISEEDSILQAFGKLENRISQVGSSENEPTADEKAALAGTDGTPSDSNKYVTNSDSRMSNARTPLSHTHVQTDVTGLGDAATKNVGTTSGSVCAGDDLRLSNTRTPTAHASSHLSGESDMIALPEVIEFIIDGGGAVITAGMKSYVEVPYACTITQATLLADQSGSIVMDIFKCTYANFDPTTHPASGDKITASAPPTISSAKKSQDSTLTGWTKALAAGDILGFNVNSCSTITRATLSLKVTRS